MTEAQTPQTQIPEARLKRSRGLPLVWLLPLVAAIIAVWLLYRDFTQGDIGAEILFPSGDGLVQGKTVVKYSGVDIGVVRDFRLVPNAQALDGADGVLAKVEFNPSAEFLLVKGSRFWLVKPEVSVTGISGLETLVSGNYIAVEPGSGGPEREFVALAQPPAQVSGEGLRVLVRAPRLASLNRGSPVYYRQLEVGEVESYRLSDNDSEVQIELFIRKRYAHLVHRGSRFWNSSGISIEGGISGVKVEVESLASLLAGGISFYTPEKQRQSPLAKSGQEFHLYSSFAEADAGIPITLNFDRGVNVTPGSTQVVYHGIKVGEVSGSKARASLDGMVVEVLMDPITDDLLTENTRFWKATPTLDISSGLSQLLEGNRIEVDLRRGQRSVREFSASAEAPQRDPRVPGLHLKLTTRDPGSLQRGASVYFRRIEVGLVQGMALNRDGSGVTVFAVIQPRYAHLVHSRTRFWNVSGLRASAGLDGLEVEADSLLSLVRGGIAFGSSRRARESAAPVRDGASFPLYPSREDAFEEGLDITIDLPSADGLREGAAIRYRGIQVGEVRRLRLGHDLATVRARATLFQHADRFARAGTRMWVVGPQIGLDNVANVDTLITGRYLELEPGFGPPQTEFRAELQPPAQDLAETLMRPGLTVILNAPRRGSLRAGSPVYYRQVQVGEVTGYALGELADRVYIYVHIQPRYRALVREHTVFWAASGIEVNFGLESGLTVHTESARALLDGGIAFATPERPAMGAEVESGSHYPLYPEVKPEWLGWRPRIELYARENAGEGAGEEAGIGVDARAEPVK
ncbi:intermembrane transport protein YebT [Microbulbifer aestuariivivens]|uniref:Intermembrane transport protein YebT n=1 Tax=Microbulbifer aestuariivivens TaxID=1908308 RepID=A0ABP9WPM7_9GAMM